ncbi:MAG: efflux RND transporter permease subunit [Myxococcales bacterium]|nr:efflux RND transporter permease subunit [Myxococcales bacterium]
MLDALIQTALRSRMAVLIATLVCLGWGLYAFRDMTIEAFPDPTDTQVNIISIYPGQPAEEVERQVSIPIERAVNGTFGLAKVRSINLFGLSFVTLTFSDGVDVLFARSQTLERLRLAELPATVTPQLGSLSTPIGEIYRYSLRSVNQEGQTMQGDPLLLRTLQDWVVRPRLLQVDGVADVVSYGGLVREIHVRAEPALLAAKGLTLRELEDALESASQNASGGVLTRGAEQLVIRSEGLFSSESDIGKVAVATRGGTPILVRDVASVKEGWAPRQGIYSRGADLDAVEGIVLMRRGENPSSVLGRLRTRIEELNARVLPAQVRIWPFYDRTELIEKTLQTVGRNLLEGAVLVILVLFVFLLDVKAALIVATTIPLSLCVAFIYLHTRGMSANLLSMGAVDFGVIVDGAVVIIEYVVSTLHHPPKLAPEQPRERIGWAVAQVARPTIFALLIIIAAYLPIFLLQRVEGRIFAPMAHTVVAALLGSLLFSITLVPVLATFAYRRGAHHRESPVLRVAEASYLPTLRVALRRPWSVMAGATSALLFAGYLLAHRGSEFLPEINEGALYLTFTLPANSSLDEGRRLMPRLSMLLGEFPQVEALSAQLGRPEDGTDATLSNNLEFFVKLKPMETWPASTPDLAALVEELKQRLSVVPGLSVNFSQPIRDNVNENIYGQFGQIALKIYHHDLKDLQAAAEAAQAAISAVRGVADLGIVKSAPVPQLQVRPQRELLGRFGLSMAEVQHFISVALGGSPVGTLWEGERNFDVVLRLPDAARNTIEKIGALRIPTKSGALIPLSAVATLRVDYGRATLNRENGRRYIGLRMNVRGRDLGSFVEEAQAAVRNKVPLKPGMSVEWGGEFESKERSMQRLKLVVPVALVITLALLFQAFDSMLLALLVLLNVPFALIGGAIGLWLVNMPISVAAAVGFIALVGQAALNGVLVVSAIEERRRAGEPLDAAIVLGAQGRLRAVLMTAALAALGLIPAALSRAIGSETQRPIAVVIVGGTLSAALLTLYVLPVMYRVLLVALAKRDGMSTSASVQ